MKEEYDLEEERVRKFLRSRGIRRVAVQLPEGLRKYAWRIGGLLEEEGVEGSFLGGSCYGACDLAEREALRAGAEALLHYGHSDMGLPSSLPVLFVEARMKVDPVEHIVEAMRGEKGKRVGVVTTVQHVDFLSKVLETLVSLGFHPLVGGPGKRTRYEGQILGCDFTSALSVAREVESFLYFGTGRFHPLGVHLATGKPVLAVDPLSGKWERMDSAVDFLRRRKGVMARAAASSFFGVVVSTKPGQARFRLAETLCGKLKGAGKEVVEVVADEIKPEVLRDLGIEAAVCVACPRIPLDDALRFELPMLTPPELLLLLGEEVEYRLDSVEASDF
ncbi:MAG: diphthamide biosynthesis enzyme Dph2 [Hadesarchaea archaeon]|nr:MAG: diphthamide biosynthesis enzyme Dph2 [Hadesarchaea archaeon]